ncbi:MAG: calcium-binding protein, partial [Acidimicrobiia bacterium]|nr:calcium-binding protein [Acidimicrobiia bacterium]
FIGPLTVDLPDQPALFEFTGFLEGFLEAKGYVDGLGDTIQAKLDETTILTFLEDLRDYLGIAPGDFALDFDPPTGIVSFRLTDSVDPGPEMVNVELAEAFADAGITASANLMASIDPSAEFGMTVRIDLNDLAAGDDDILNRLLIQDVSLTADAPVTADLDLAGAIGFLGLTITSGGEVPLLQTRAGDDHMFEVTFAETDPVAIADLPDALLTDLDASLAVQVPTTTLTLSADTTAGTNLASCSAELSWPDVTSGTPDFEAPSADTCFDDLLRPFAFDTDDPRALFGQILTALRLVFDELDGLVGGTDSPLRAEVPMLGISVADLVDTFTDLLDDMDALLVADSESTLQELEDAIEQLLVDRLGITDAEAEALFALTIDPPSTGSGAVLNVSFGINEGDTVQQPFSLDFGTGGFFGTEGDGEVNVSWSADGTLAFGIELPQWNGSGFTGSVRPFLDDSTSLNLAASLDAETTLTGSLGPVSASLGAAGNEMEAHVDLGVTLSNSDPDGRIYLLEGTELGDWLDDLLPASLGDLDGDTTECDSLGFTDAAACAVLPVYLGTTQLDADDSVAGDQPITCYADPVLSAPICEGVEAIFSDLASEAFAWALLAEGLQALADALADLLSTSEYDVSIPFLGDTFDGPSDAGDGDTRISEVVRQLGVDIGDILDDLSSLTPDGARAALEVWLEANLGTLLGDSNGDGTVDNADVEVLAFCGDPLVACNDTDHGFIGDLVDIQIRFTVGESGTTDVVDAPIDAGLPGLRLTTQDGTVSVDYNWSVDVGLGISDNDGFYVITDGGGVFGTDEKEVELSTGLSLPDIGGELAFVPFELEAQTDPDVEIGLNVDLVETDGRLTLVSLGGIDAQSNSDINVELCGGVSIDRAFTLGGQLFDGDAAGLPGVTANFIVDWPFADCGTDGMPADGTNGPGDYDLTDDFYVAFEDVAFDPGSLVRDFAEPILEDVAKYVGPIRPIVDELNNYVPVISDALDVIGVSESKWPTWIDLLESVSGNDLTLVRRIAELIQFVDDVSNASLAGSIPIGDLVIAGADAAGAAPAANSVGSLIDMSRTAPDANYASEMRSKGGPFGDRLFADDSGTPKDAANNGGFRFPVFEDPQNVFEYLLGKDVTLIEWDAGDLSARYTIGPPLIPPIPIPLGPVVITIKFSGFIGAGGHFAVGYDTYGIRQALAGNLEGLPSYVDALLAGVFINDFDSQGREVPEVYLETGVSVSGSLDLLIAEGGARGTLRGEVEFDLRDDDGKVRIEEILDNFRTPICLFEINALVEVILELFYEINYLIGSTGDSWEIVRFTLFEAKDLIGSSCGANDDAPPELGNYDDTTGILTLNAGPNATDRNVSEGEPFEDFTVRQVSALSGGEADVEVTAFGITMRYDDVTEVHADMGSADDTLEFLSGAPVSGGQFRDPIPFTLPTKVCGGTGADRIIGGSGVDRISGDTDAANAGLSGCDGVVEPGSESNDDTIDAGRGNDQVSGGPGNDAIQGGAGMDTLRGGADDDRILGGIDADTIFGDAGDDVLQGGPEPFGDDCTVTIVDPDDPENPDAASQEGACPSDNDDPSLVDTIDGGSGDDDISGGFGNDILSGGPDNDTVRGGPGNDTINGDAGATSGTDGADVLVGDDGDDTINGNGGDDSIDAGDDNDTVSGGDGADIIVGGTDTEPLGDSLNGDAGNDVLLGDLPSPALLATVIELWQTVDPDDICKLGLTSDHAGDDEMLGGPGLDRICGQDGDDTINGGADADDIFGGRGDDTIGGDGGDDEIHGEDGDDTINGGDGGDDIFGGDGEDLVHGDPGPDNIEGNDDDDEIHGDEGDDTIDGGEGDDLIEGDADSDTINGGGGADRILGGGSEDLGAPDAGDTIFGDGGDDIILGDNGEIAPDGSYQACIILASGSFGDDTVEGGLGNDVINGQDGDDKLDGNAGNDLIFGEYGDDVIDGGPDFDVLLGDCGTAPSTNTFTPSGALIRDVTLINEYAGGEDIIYGGTEDDAIYGGAAADLLFGEDGDDLIEGNEGDDTAFGGDGGDDIVGGTSAPGKRDGDDTLSGEDGADVIAGDNASIARPLDPVGNWQIDPERGGTLRTITLHDVALADEDPPSADTYGNDVILGGDGPDRAYGQGGDDGVDGGSADDEIEGNAGDDLLLGSSGDDDLIGGGSASDGVISTTSIGNGLADGEDEMYGGTGDDVLAGDNARINHPADTSDIGGDLTRLVTLFDVERATTDPVSGEAHGGDTMLGEDGDDYLFGQGGPDTIRGGEGNDQAEGNADADIIDGDAGDDNVIGGGSAVDGVIDADRLGNSLLDEGDVLSGGTGQDVIAGDNARVIFPVDTDQGFGLEVNRAIRLFDIQRSEGPNIKPETSGGDIIEGGPNNDVIFGQGNGDQSTELVDPPDGIDNDRDGWETNKAPKPCKGD